jgi:hypothetical protein
VTGPKSHARLKAEGVATFGGPPVTLHGDDKLVRACLAQGGFPRAVATSIGTVWAGPEGKPWAGARKTRKVRA